MPQIIQIHSFDYLRNSLFVLLFCPIFSAARADGHLEAYDNITGITDGVNAANSRTYGYDARGRLSMVEQLRSGQVIYNRQDYRHDANGNRTALERRFSKGQVSLICSRAGPEVTGWTDIASGMAYKSFASVTSATLGNAN